MPPKTIVKKKPTGNQSTKIEKPVAETEPIDGVKDFAKEIAAQIIAGTFDAHLSVIDDALTDRANAHAKEEAAERRAAKKAAASTVETPKVVPQPTRAPVPDALEVGKYYRIDPTVKKVGGLKVKFLRFRKDDIKKAVVEVMVDTAERPKGTRIVVPANMLRKSGNVKRKVK